MKLPALLDISPTNLLNLDERVAHENFFGKSMAEARRLFDQHDSYADDLGWMGAEAFGYYVCAYIDHLSERNLSEVEIEIPMSIVLRRLLVDKNHRNIKKLINKISQLRSVLICGDRKIEKEYDEAVARIFISE